MKIIYLLIFLAFSSFADTSVAFVKISKGDAHILRAQKELPVKVGSKLFQKDTIITDQKSRVGIVFKDNTRISIGANSKFEIQQYLFEPANKKEAFVTNLSKGTLECFTGLISKVNPKAFKIKVKTATIGIRGTHFIINADK